MFAGIPLGWWIGFHILVVALIVCDLAVIHRGRQAESTRRSALFTILLLVLAAAFAGWVWRAQGGQPALEFASGYLIELSLSVDNLFVFLLLFRTFGLDPAAQRKALLWGVLGAIVMRGIFIFAGIALLERFFWIEYIFGAILLVAAVRLLRKQEEASAPRWIARLARPGARSAMLAAIFAIEITDLVFALDSVPAVLAISQRPFIVYTSNILAILGLRSLYFVLAGLLDRLRYLHYGLAAILFFVGAKMLTGQWIKVPVAVSLGIILGVIAIAAVASLAVPARQRAEPDPRPESAK